MYVIRPQFFIPLISLLRNAAMNSLKYRYEHKRSDNVLIVSKNGKTNYFYLFGGKDESSQDLIQRNDISRNIFR